MTNRRISLFIVARNAEHHIAKCILSAKHLVHEIIVVDGLSKDKTALICRDLGTLVYERAFDNWTAQKNFALSKVTSEWALFLEPDETLTPELAEEIQQAVHNGQIDGCTLPRVTDFLGKRLRRNPKRKMLLRLVRTQKAAFKNTSMHESLHVDGPTAPLKNVFVQHPYTSLEPYLDQLNRHSTLAAQSLFEQGKKTGLVRLLLSAPASFVSGYIFRTGFLDGMRGFIWAAFASFYAFVTNIKLWYLWERKNK